MSEGGHESRLEGEALLLETVLSVVVIAGGQRRRASRCLESLLAQGPIDRMEILFVDCAGPGAPALVGSDHPSVRPLPFPTGARPLFGEMRAEGVRRARAPVVGFLEEHCRALPGWAEPLLDAHREPWAGVGGEVWNGNPGEGLSDAILLMTFGPWTAPARRQEHVLLPGNNTSYKREVLLRLGDDLGPLLLAEPVLQWRLGRERHRLLLEPNARFTRENERTLARICRGYFLWNRCFAWSRGTMLGESPWKNRLRVAASPLIPWVRAGRLLRFVLKERRGELGTVSRALPAVWIAQAASAAGQVAGLTRGLGDAERRFTEYELNEPRSLADVLPHN